MTRDHSDIDADLTAAGQDRVRLARNARFYRYDKTLDDAADLFDDDPAAWQRLHPLLQDRSGIYRDQREDYRRAVEAGAIPDDRTPKGDNPR